MSFMDFLFWLGVIPSIPFIPAMLIWEILSPSNGQTTPGMILVLPMPLAFVSYLLLTVFVSHWFLVLATMTGLSLLSLWAEIRS